MEEERHRNTGDRGNDEVEHAPRVIITALSAVLR